MTTWEDAVKFLHTHRCAHGSFDLLSRACGKAHEAWFGRDAVITSTLYSRTRDILRAYCTNDLRYARALDKGD